MGYAMDYAIVLLLMITMILATIMISVVACIVRREGWHGAPPARESQREVQPTPPDSEARRELMGTSRTASANEQELPRNRAATRQPREADRRVAQRSARDGQNPGPIEPLGPTTAVSSWPPVQASRNFDSRRNFARTAQDAFLRSEESRIPYRERAVPPARQGRPPAPDRDREAYRELRGNSRTAKGNEQKLSRNRAASRQPRKDVFLRSEDFRQSDDDDRDMPSSFHEGSPSAPETEQLRWRADCENTLNILSSSLWSSAIQRCMTESMDRSGLGIHGKDRIWEGNEDRSKFTPGPSCVQGLREAS